MKSRLFTAILFAVQLSAFSLQPSGAVEPNKVVIGNNCVLWFRVSSGGYSPQERADKVYERLVPILSDVNWKPSDIVGRAHQGDVSIYVGSHLLVTITKADAAASNSNVQQASRNFI